VPCCRKYTPTDCFFGDFVHWAAATSKQRRLYNKSKEVFGLKSSFIKCVLFSLERLRNNAKT